MTALAPGLLPKRVFIVDDHPVVREGLAQMINREAGLSVCGEAEDGVEAVALIRTEKPDIVVADLSLKNASGIDLIKTLKQQQPKIPVLVLSMHDECLYAERVLHAGAKGYIMKGEANSKVVFAIRRVLMGDIYVGDRVAEKFVRQLAGGKPDVNRSSLDQLSNRELEVFALIGKGHKTCQIADMLALSIKTVNTYREHIKQKLSFESGVDLVRHAIHWVEQQASDSRSASSPRP